jgi:hypothetical protein
VIRPRLALIVLLATGVVSSTRAAPPVLEALFPAGGQAGATFTLTAVGKVETGDRLWIDCPGVHLVPNGKKREWQVTIEPDTPPAVCLVYAWNREGASAPRWFSIGTIPEASETEPNDEAAKAQVIEKLPATINARLEKSGDVDHFTVKMEKDQTLLAAVEAYSLGSPVDVMAHVLDEQGVRVLTVSDSRNLDPAFQFKAPKAGRYTVQLAGFVHPPQADVRFTGGATAVYRLHLSAGPVVTGLIPAVVAREGKAEVELLGLALDAKKTRHTFEPAPAQRDGDIVAVAVPGAAQAMQGVVNGKPGLVEKEPNNESAQGQPVAIGDAIGGRLADKDPADRFALTVKKGEKLTLRVFARRIGSLLDPVLEVLNKENKSVLTQDDVGDSSDPNAEWTVPADGDYQVVVKDRFGRGGEPFTYVLQISPSSPSLTLAIADGKPIALEAGKTASVKVNVKLSGEFKEPPTLRISGLPLGVHAAEAAVPAKGGDVELKLEAAANASGHSGPIAVAAWYKDNGASHVKPGTHSLRGESLRGTSLLDQSPTLWLTVRGK